ncbi:hypothetical protein RAH32_08590 [Paracoccus sp. WLY502]|uniref:hypothetical protein n=1 Tax=Paracoccus yibinensis TaxID=3068891 RepID=UPI002796D37C|nr:hypothetical protein [Paracoccus sp. WLY502]MDQ1900500.1 hypothetical protein [Paracoccus sp. WLY502]
MRAMTVPFLQSCGKPLTLREVPWGNNPSAMMLALWHGSPDGDMAELDEWWKNAVIHGVDVERLCDSDGDGVGNFAGHCAVALHPCGRNGHADRVAPVHDK